MKILIKNGKVWDGNKFLFADILTEENMIYKISENISDEADFIFDATGKTVTPGLVDTHVHIKGIAPEEFGAEVHSASFPFGVTAVNDAGSRNGSRMLLDCFAVKNTVFVCVDIKNNHADFTITEKLLERYGDKAIGIKVYLDTTITECRDITPLKEICDYAKIHNLKVMVHCSDSPVTMTEIVDTLTVGDILTHVYHSGNNSCSENDFDALRLAKEKGVILDCGFAGYVHTDFSKLRKSLSYGLLPDTISTDITRRSAYKRGGRYGMTMCMSMAKHLGMSEEEIFSAVTSAAAKALDKEKEWGYLSVGRVADIAVFDYTNEEFDMVDKAGNSIRSEVGYRCVLTVSDGEVVYKE